VISYSVTQRTSEIGIRRALGAQSRDVLKFLMSNGVILSLIGIAMGLAGSLALTRLMEGLLFKMSPTDPATFISIPLLLMVIILLAILVPAQRATKIDPMIALRHE
jgi:putative ABC transport system permease protein